VVAPNRAGIAAIPAWRSVFSIQTNTPTNDPASAIPISVRATGQGQAQPTVVAEHGVATQKKRRRRTSFTSSRLWGSWRRWARPWRPTMVFACGIVAGGSLGRRFGVAAA